MKRKTKIFLVDCICFMLLAGCIGQTEPVEIVPTEIVEEEATAEAETTAEEEMLLEDDKEPEEKKEHVYEQNEAYKMFYGTWEFTEVVSQYRKLCGDEGYEELIGTRVSYYPTAYRCNKNFIPNPTYLMSIFPQDPDGYNLFFEDQINLTELLPDADYFVWVEIVNIPADEVESPYAIKFFLKDDNTIYVFEKNCIYELKRVSYIKDYDPDEIISYRERF